jgi:hypothetical protein
MISNLSYLGRSSEIVKITSLVPISEITKKIYSLLKLTVENKFCVNFILFDATLGSAFESCITLLGP